MAAKKGKENTKNMEVLNKRYQSRFTLAKQGKAAYQGSDFMNAIKSYNSYIRIISEVKDISEKRLNPGLFSPKTELTEIMLISHIYWDLARIYDRTPHLRDEFLRCINQFQSFTIGQPYQVVNAEMLRRYIRSGKLVNKADFQDAYKNIYVSSKKCYVATHCFGFDAIETNNIRKIKPHLLQTHMGQLFVEYYYRFSPQFVTFLQKRPLIDFFLTKVIIRPSLKVFSKMIEAFIMK